MSGADRGLFRFRSSLAAAGAGAAAPPPDELPATESEVPGANRRVRARRAESEWRALGRARARELARRDPVRARRELLSLPVLRPLPLRLGRGGAEPPALPLPVAVSVRAETGCDGGRTVPVPVAPAPPPLAGAAPPLAAAAFADATRRSPRRVRPSRRAVAATRLREARCSSRPRCAPARARPFVRPPAPSLRRVGSAPVSRRARSAPLPRRVRSAPLSCCPRRPCSAEPACGRRSERTLASDEGTDPASKDVQTRQITKPTAALCARRARRAASSAAGRRKRSARAGSRARASERGGEAAMALGLASTARSRP